MNTHYHPKHGVKYSTIYVELTLENPDPKFHIPSDTPLCREVVDTLHLPMKMDDGSFRYLPIDKDFLIEVLAYAKELESKEPVYRIPSFVSRGK